MPVRIVLADNQAMFAEMLKQFLSRKENNFVIVGEAVDSLEVRNLVSHYHPDVLLLDYRMPGVGCLASFCPELAECSPATRILVVSGHVREQVAIEAAIGGAHGYISKIASLSELLTAIETVSVGGIWIDPHLPLRAFQTFLSHAKEGTDRLKTLSRQELNVLALLAQGKSNKQIGTHLHISPKTVKNHLTRIFAKLGSANRQEATQYFLAEKEKRQHYE